MKTTPEQQSLLQRHLRKILRYRETYGEFYDHILTAVEAEKADVIFDDAVIGVIKNAFGGAQGMRSIEEQYKLSVFKELKKKYLDHAMDNFRFPGLLITIVLSALIYFMVKQPWFNLNVFLFNLLAIRTIPGILIMLSNIRSPKVYGAPKRSIKSDFFKWQNFFAVFIFFIAFSMATSNNFPDPPAAFKKLIPGVPTMTILMILIVLHSLTYYKVYRDDIKNKFKTA
jgi:hypothetical protein